MPLFSIIMTVGPEQRWLGEAIRSVRDSRGCDDWELIVWLDGVGLSEPSRSITPGVAADKRIRVVEREKAGRWLAFNAAAREASGEWLGWVDADDLLHPEALRLCEEKEEADDDLLVTGMNRIDASGAPAAGVRHPSPWLPRGRSLSYHLALIRRALFDSLGGADESFDLAADVDLLLRAEEAARAVAVIDKPLYFYRQHSASLSRTRSAEQRHWAQAALRRAKKRRGIA